MALTGLPSDVEKDTSHLHTHVHYVYLSYSLVDHMDEKDGDGFMVTPFHLHWAITRPSQRVTLNTFLTNLVTVLFIVSLYPISKESVGCKQTLYGIAIASLLYTILTLSAVWPPEPHDLLCNSTPFLDEPARRIQIQNNKHTVAK